MLDHLRARLAAHLPHLPLTRPTGFVSLTLALPEPPVRLPQLSSGAQFHLTQTHAGELRSGYGVAAEWQASGTQRLQQLAAVARTWATDWQQVDPDHTGYPGFALLGFAAADSAELISLDATDHQLPNALLWIPQIALRKTATAAALIFTVALPTTPERALQQWLALLAPLVTALYPPRAPALQLRALRERGALSLTPTHLLPNYNDWCQLVRQALVQINAGVLSKVVLSRQLTITAGREFDLERLHGALADLFPSCQIINLRHTAAAPAAHLVAATPERLLHLRGRRVEVDAIAGTVARAKSAEQDAALSAALRASAKDLLEHRYVVDAVWAALLPLCSGLETSPLQVMQLNNAQHLWTPVVAEVNAGVDVFDLAERLHPTPATNGEPRATARAWLQAHEPFSRGWYTGAAGWIEPDVTTGGLNADLWVLLRCAHICGAAAELHAGSGIVTGSDPQAEWQETEAKLSAMLTALQFV
ncbi:isochorismate synthase [Rhodoferax sp. 4810]|uniref:isochorismate synthase n=1 Tax=Thiospirillum jenense TaxID=1653858 RepID=A0A839HDW9_9GAMM|nr:isochorismate synthase [Thiospirillum jenense]MBB1073836.1 isochorismate synthase [Rhodoferax jenense]MBB1125209.1 isochorismate synthase [Thiospirillum jenense]